MNFSNWLVLAGVALVALAIIALFVKSSVPRLVNKPETDEDLKKSVQEVVDLAYQGDALAGAKIIRHLGDESHSDFQGLIAVVDDKVVFSDPSAPQSLEWHICEGDDGEVVTIRDDSRPVPLITRPIKKT